MWLSNTQPYVLCHLSLVLGATGVTGPTWRLYQAPPGDRLVDKWSLKSGQEYKRGQLDKGH